ncbi:hypothetical protein TNCV_877681 [Trichonephila clavipes]|nr:hypothetical protein TNCV_877681 [Trichonephila clavipes]
MIFLFSKQKNFSPLHVDLSAETMPDLHCTFACLPVTYCTRQCPGLGSYASSSPPLQLAGVTQLVEGQTRTPWTPLRPLTFKE